MNIQPNAVATRDKTLAIMGVFSSNVYTTATYTRWSVTATVGKSTQLHKLSPPLLRFICPVLHSVVLTNPSRA